jgi:hypothetical protein
VEGISQKRDTRVASIAPLSSELPKGLGDAGQYQGIRPPNFYAVALLISNDDGGLRPGMAGIARVYGRRRSLAGFAAQEVANFVGRKVW